MNKEDEHGEEGMSEAERGKEEEECVTYLFGSSMRRPVADVGPFSKLHDRFVMTVATAGVPPLSARKNVYGEDLHLLWQIDAVAHGESRWLCLHCQEILKSHSAFQILELEATWSTLTSLDDRVLLRCVCAARRKTCP